MCVRRRERDTVLYFKKEFVTCALCLKEKSSRPSLLDVRFDNRLFGFTIAYCAIVKIFFRGYILSLGDVVYTFCVYIRPFL